MNAFRQARAFEHWLKYEEIAKRIGVDALRNIVLRIASEEKIRASLQTDANLNNVPLSRWDAHDDSVRLISNARFWSLSMTVCVLKHVARYYVAGQPPPVTVTDELSAARRAEIDAELRRLFPNTK